MFLRSLLCFLCFLWGQHKLQISFLWPRRCLLVLCTQIFFQLVAQDLVGLTVTALADFLTLLVSLSSDNMSIMMCSVVENCEWYGFDYFTLKDYGCFVQVCKALKDKCPSMDKFMGTTQCQGMKMPDHGKLFQCIDIATKAHGPLKVCVCHSKNNPLAMISIFNTSVSYLLPPIVSLGSVNMLSIISNVIKNWEWIGFSCLTLEEYCNFVQVCKTLKDKCPSKVMFICTSQCQSMKRPDQCRLFQCTNTATKTHGHLKVCGCHTKKDPLAMISIFSTRVSYLLPSIPKALAEGGTAMEQAFNYLLYMYIYIYYTTCFLTVSWQLPVSSLQVSNIFLVSFL